MTTYLGDVIRVSRKNKLKLEEIKRKRRFKNFDSIITKLLNGSESSGRKDKKKPVNLLDSRDFGL